MFIDGNMSMYISEIIKYYYNTAKTMHKDALLIQIYVMNNCSQ